LDQKLPNQLPEVKFCSDYQHECFDFVRSGSFCRMVSASDYNLLAVSIPGNFEPLLSLIEVVILIDYHD
jgi:hypothetical protein